MVISAAIYTTSKITSASINWNLKIKRHFSNLILEGGGVTFDGKGTMITTEKLTPGSILFACESRLKILTLRLLGLRLLLTS